MKRGKKVSRPSVNERVSHDVATTSQRGEGWTSQDVSDLRRGSGNPGLWTKGRSPGVRTLVSPRRAADMEDGKWTTKEGVDK